MERRSGISLANISGREVTLCPQWGRDETVIRDYIRNQEQEDKRLDQMNLWR